MSTIDELLHDKVRVRCYISEAMRDIKIELAKTDIEYLDIYDECKDDLKDLEVMMSFEDVLDRKIEKLRR